MNVASRLRETGLGSLPPALLFPELSGLEQELPRPTVRWGTPLHGLATSGGRTRFLPPLPEDEADLFNAGESGHERIEYDALRPLIRDDRMIAAIYFGNWQRDMSQLLAPALSQYLGHRAGLTCDLIFEVVDVLAEARFNQRLNRERFGTYRWEEHIDNPREFGVALQPATCTPVPGPLRSRLPELEPEAPRWGLRLWSEGPDATPLYLHTSRQYVLGQLALAFRHGRTARGLEHFGNAMHTVEDIYAHSNFIELGYNLLRGDNPHTGEDPSGRPLRDSRGRYRLTTGIFLLNDTVVSINKLFLNQLESPPGGRPSPLSRRVQRVLIRRRLGDRALAIYDRLMRLWESTRIPAVQRRIQEALERAVLFPLRLAIAALLRPLASAAARQTGRRLYPMPPGSPISRVHEISHSLLAKDDPVHRYYGVARQLAIRAVRDFWCQMDDAWNRRRSPDFRGLVQLYMNHPQAVGRWWVPILEGRPLPAAMCRPSPAPPRGRTTPLMVLDAFAFQSAALTPRHVAAIKRIADHLARLASAGGVVRLVGHTDSQGSAAYNLRLGEARAQAARQALARALEQRPGRAQAFRLVVESRGEEQPVVDNGTPQGRAKNRRVEILLEGSTPSPGAVPRPQRR